ncbi:MAG: glycosyltransferase [Flavobacteriaceae bacterium]|nr:glycosyltransferase [Flavobacteriaceae bacterium]
MDLHFSVIIPIYNRPEELLELLDSLSKQHFDKPFEIIVVEDGSQLRSDKVIKQFNKLNIKYFFKENSGPGDSRNFGMQKASGNYFIILDSDCILPDYYLKEVDVALQINFTDAYGGADAAHESFTIIQKAINYSMTSLFTTGGLRGSDKVKSKFQPRSFNMGISKKAFVKTKGFSKQHYGEDIDLTFKLWKLGFETQFIPKAFVYHKRRTSWKQFFDQTFNFGAARPILNKMHQGSAKITYWFPSLFILGLLLAVLLFFNRCYILLFFYGVYFILIFTDSTFKNKCNGKLCIASVIIGFNSIIATLVQFFGYGLGFLRSFLRLHVLNSSKEKTFPKMFR